MKRCFYFQRPMAPVTVVKNQTGLLESTKSIMNIKDCYNIWKKTSEEICVVQRYIYPQNNQVCKYRVKFSVPENCFTQKIMKNPINVLGNRANEFNPIKVFRTIEEDDKFLVKSQAFGDESKVTDEKLKIQMQALKKIIETEEVKNHYLSVLVADFLQDQENFFYFIEMVDYSYQSSLQKDFIKKKIKIKRKGRFPPLVKSLPSLDMSINKSFIHANIKILKGVN